MFFEDVNMLLPVETFTDTVYKTTDRMGTYSLVDMEIFFSNLRIESLKANENGKEISVNSPDKESLTVYTEYRLNKMEFKTQNPASNANCSNNFDVVFLLMK